MSPLRQRFGWRTRLRSSAGSALPGVGGLAGSAIAGSRYLGIARGEVPEGSNGAAHDDLQRVGRCGSEISSRLVSAPEPLLPLRPGIAPRAWRARRRVRPSDKLPLIALSLVMLLTACGGRGNALAGPDPGGGYPCANNAFEDCANL
jgi:hypothetical protein